VCLCGEVQVACFVELNNMFIYIGTRALDSEPPEYPKLAEVCL
jgi:hypothetical protein